MRIRLARVPGQSVGRVAIFKRDGWRCQWCSRDTPRDLMASTDPLAPELDHIMPLARGGKHTAQNVCCSCRHCNRVKGDRIGEDFLNAMLPHIHSIHANAA